MQFLPSSCPSLHPFMKCSTGNLPAPRLLRPDPALQAAGPLLALPGARGTVSLISWSLPAGELGSQVHTLHLGSLSTHTTRDLWGSKSTLQI